MATDFTVIIRVRQQFATSPDVFPGVPYAGTTKDFPFDCPNVDPEAEAVLMFQTRDVNKATNIIQINPETAQQPTIHGGIPVSPGKDAWNGNIMLITPNVLRETNNTLRIIAFPWGIGQDSFIIDNCVVLYKTKENRGPGGVVATKEDVAQE